MATLQRDLFYVKDMAKMVLNFLQIMEAGKLRKWLVYLYLDIQNC